MLDLCRVYVNDGTSRIGRYQRCLDKNAGQLEIPKRGCVCKRERERERKDVVLLLPLHPSLSFPRPRVNQDEGSCR